MYRKNTSGRYLFIGAEGFAVPPNKQEKVGGQGQVVLKKVGRQDKKNVNRGITNIGGSSRKRELATFYQVTGISCFCEHFMMKEVDYTSFGYY